MSTIKYVGYYDNISNKEENRNYVLAATNKMDYIINVVNTLNINIDIISACGTKNINEFYKSKKVNLSYNKTLKLFSAFSSNKKVIRIIGMIFLYTQLFLFLIFNTKRNDKVIVYHSLPYVSLIYLIKKIKKINLILEVEEIYSDVILSNSARKKEYKLFNVADAFIFPTELLNEKLNKLNKPYTILYGTYQIEEDRNINFNDNKIHCVYAGTFMESKGVFSAVNTGYFLNEKYHLHIIGFGSEKDKQRLLEQIDIISKKSTCKVTFDGLLCGEDYIRFIQSCHVGLSVQNPNAEYNETSFPSKVLSYMANGLRVVSIKIKTLDRSAIKSLLYYYKDDNPEEIANAIKKIDFNDNYDSRVIIKELDVRFKENIKKILQ